MNNNAFGQGKHKIKMETIDIFEDLRDQEDYEADKFS